MSLSIYALLSTLLMGLSELHLTQGVLPGAQVRFTNAAFDYGVGLVTKKFKDDAIGIDIRRQSGGRGSAKYTVSGLHISAVDVNQSSFRPDQSGGTLSLTLGGISLSLKGRYRWKRGKGYFVEKGGGDIHVTSTGIRLQVDMDFSAKSGRSVLNIKECACNISSLKPLLSGDTGGFLTSLQALFEGKKMIASVEKAVCSPALNGMKEAFRTLFKKTKPKVSIFKRFAFDYGVLHEPHFASSYIETHHRAEIFWKANRTISATLAAPKPFPPFTDSSRMVYIWLSEYVAQSFSQAAFAHGFFHYNKTTGYMPTAARMFLRSRCNPKYYTCFGTIVKTADKNRYFPDSKIMLEPQADEVPSVVIANNTVTVAATGSVKLYAVCPKYPIRFMLHLSANVTTSVHVTVRKNKLYPSFSNTKLALSVISSKLGPISADMLSRIVKASVDSIVTPKLNGIGARGVALPVSGAIELTKPRVSLLQGSVLIESDLVFRG